MSQPTGSDKNFVAMFVRSRIFKVILILSLSMFFSAVYINFFQHPPPDMLLQMNSRGGGFDPNKYRSDDGAGSRVAERGNNNQGYEDDFEEEDEDTIEFKAEGANAGDEEEGEEEEIEERPSRSRPRHSSKRLSKPKSKLSKSSKSSSSRNSSSSKKVAEGSNSKQKSSSGKKHSGGSSSSRSSSGSSGVKYADYWATFIRKYRYVSIGAVYDKCEHWTVQYGTVIMLPDKEKGGVKSRTFVNVTLPHEIDGGQFNIEVKYNGKDLYDNYWELCDLEEELPPANRTFNCPIAGGVHHKVKDRHIPNYLPKGRYETKAWATDEDQKVFACGYSDFTI